MKLIFNKWLVITGLFLLIFNMVGIGQVSLRHIRTNEVFNRLKAENPSLSENRAAIEQFTADYVKNGKPKKVVLPLVFHILYDSPERRVTAEQVYAQLEALNRDFSKKAYKIKHQADTLEGFDKKAADMEIEFCLVKEAPDGKKTEGMNFISTAVTQWTYNDAMKMADNRGQDAWDPEKYVNIWVVSLADSVNGYAQMPGGSAETDGIVIDYRFFGEGGTAKAPFNQGKTLVHLMGNYLNLYDLWGPCFCCDDGVEDTPIHNAPNYTEVQEYKHISTCLGNPVEMSMNFMDNTEDDWMYMFTAGQKLRMHAVLVEGGARYGLTQQKTPCSAGGRSKELPILTEIVNGVDIQLFPNPSTGISTLRIDSDKETDVQLTIYSISGQLLHEKKINLVKGIQNEKIDGRNWPNGVYWVWLRVKDQSFRQKLVLMHP